MIRPQLALFTRALREGTRLRVSLVTRLGFVLVLFILLAAVSSSAGWGNTPGLRFFRAVTGLNAALIMLAALGHFAPAITEEKEAMTLGLLRMTGLGALSILLGKSTSRLVIALFLLAAQFPLTLLAVLPRGVTFAQVAAAYCTLGAGTVLVANFALLASVICRRSTAAAALTGATFFAFFVGVPFLRTAALLPVNLGIADAPSPAVLMFDHFADAVLAASLLHRLGQIFEPGFSGRAFGSQVWIDLALGAGCFLLAWALFERFCGEEHEAMPSRNLLARRTSRLRIFGAGRAWRLAPAWKDFYFIAGDKVWLAIKLALYSIPTLLVYAAQARWTDAIRWKETGYFTMWIASSLAALELAVVAASFLRHERQWKTLSALALLPLGMRQIVYQKFLGGLVALLPAAACFAFGFTCVAQAGSHPGWPHWPVANAYFLAQWILLLHLAAALSLYFRRGGLPAAIAVLLVWNLFVAIFLTTTREPAWLPWLAGLTAALALGLHVYIPRRLEQLAQEE